MHAENDVKSPTSYQHPNHKPHYSYANTRLKRSSYYTLVSVFDVNPLTFGHSLTINLCPTLTCIHRKINKECHMHMMYELMG
jgi:hypothetical protein